ncbi:MAG: hypothetical protein J0L58_03720 [Burkholderiales bacterium]|uniref:hypothetical protein n=1 Tax=Inhella sp. TaxID=1921806 RepID=UPI001AD39CB8|nr:hypothetical protein [Burkholderiales bacterium]
MEVSVELLSRVVAAYEQLGLQPPALLRSLPVQGWLPLPDPLAFLRDASGEPLAAPVREQLGAQVVDDWYHAAGGYSQCQTALDVLRLHVQMGSYGLVARGPSCGSFKLLALDEAAGMAQVHSSTPFCRHWEAGLIQGALDATGDLLYSDVRWMADLQRFELRFVSDGNRANVAWALGEPEDARVWRLRDRVRRLEKRNAYLEARPAGTVSTARRSSPDWLDPLTGAATEAHLVAHLRQMAQLPLPPQLCVLSYGVRGGTDAQALRELGAAGQRLTRGADLLARLGEDRLALVLHEVDREAGGRIADRLRQGLDAALQERLALALHTWRGDSVGALLERLRG